MVILIAAPSLFPQVFQDHIKQKIKQYQTINNESQQGDLR